MTALMLIFYSELFTPDILDSESFKILFEAEKNILDFKSTTILMVIVEK